MTRQVVAQHHSKSLALTSKVVTYTLTPLKRWGRGKMATKAIIRYDGPALASHQMDINDLAPALLALGDLIRDCNRILNGKDTTVRVLINADLEQNCFELGFEVIQSFGDQIMSLIGQDGAKSAKEILEWIGIITSGSAFVSASILHVLNWLAKRKKEGVTYNITANDGSVIYIADNGATINVPPPVHQLLQAPEVIRNAKKVIAPVATEGISSVEFEHNGLIAQEINEDEAQDILKLPQSEVIEDGQETEHVSEIRTSVRIKRAVYEGGGKWTIIYQRPVEAAILDEDFVDRFQKGDIKAPPRSVLDVDLIVRVPVDKDSIATGSPSYEVTKIHGVKLPPEQQSLL